MDPVLLFFLILMAIAIGWSIGANDAANSIGTAVGSRVLTLWQAIVLVSVCGFLGAYFQGKYVSHTIGKGIVPLHELDPAAAMYVAIVSAFAACTWVILATYWKMPISTSHSIVGAVAGAGMAIHSHLKWKVLIDIFICWIFTPLGAALLGFIFYLVFKNVFYQLVPRRFMRAVLSFLIIASGSYVAYSWGANDIANAIGVVAGTGAIPMRDCMIMGGLAIVLGVMTWGYKVIETIGTEITHLLPLMAFCAQLASAVNVHIYTVFGIPVSTSHSIVGAIFGVGLVKGARVLNMQIAKNMLMCWIATPFISGLISYLTLRIIMHFAKIGG